MGRLLGWLGWAGLDAVVRLAVMTLSTIAFSRLLTPHDFGTTALVTVAVSVCAGLVGAPFQESLAQQRNLVRQHVEAAVAAALAVGVVLLLLSVPLGTFLARVYREPVIATFLPVAMISIFFSGYTFLMNGLARRQRRFNIAAIAAMLGHVVGIAISVAMAYAGHGMWALIAQRLLICVFEAIVIFWLLQIRVMPRWSLPHLRDMSRVSGLNSLDRLSQNLGYLLYNYLVGAIYGLTALGHVNMAMRLIEPIRGTFLAVSHNLAFFYFASAQNEPGELRDKVEAILARTALATTPVFTGFAAVMPVMLPLFAGPGWEASVDIAICLAAGSAILMSTRPIYTALSASARPGIGLVANIASLALSVVVLVAASGLGPMAIGLSRLSADILQSVIAVCMSPHHLDWLRIKRLHALLPAWLSSMLMGAVVLAFSLWALKLGRPIALFLSIYLGVLIYAATVRIFARPYWDELVAVAHSITSRASAGISRS